MTSDVHFPSCDSIGSDPSTSYFDARRVPPALRTAMRLLELEQVKPPQVGDVAAHVGLSVAHFSRSFAAAFGQTAAAYSRRIRLDHVASRILFDPAPLHEIANLFGFESQAAFNRAFRNQHGAPPREFIARLRQTISAPSELPADTHVGVVERKPEIALARRFFGSDITRHWQDFLEETPAFLAKQSRQAGLLYDLPAVTPPQHRRYDCAVSVDMLDPSDVAVTAVAGLDAVEIPGGLHAEVHGCSSPADVSAAIRFLYRVWLPDQKDFAPEGDPMVHWRGEGPEPSFTATIRIRRLSDLPAWNMVPLDAALQPMGSR